MNYYNTTFFNKILPVILFSFSMILVILSVFSPVFAFLGIAAMVYFKWFHGFLENKSLQMRYDYKLYDSNGQLHWKSLNNYSHEQLIELSKHYENLRGKNEKV